MSKDPVSLSLKGRLRFLAKDSILYGGVGAFNKAFALFAFPILARHFSVVEYGTIDLFTSVIALLTVLFVFGQDSAVARYFYEYDDDFKKKQVISQSLMFQVLGLLFFCPLLWILSEKIHPFISDSSKAQNLFQLSILQLPFMVLINFSQNILKWTYSRSYFLILSIGSTVISVLSLLVLVLCYSLREEDVFVVYLIVRAFFGFLGLWFVKNWLVRPNDFRILKELLLYAMPLGVVCFIGATMPMIERAIIFQRLGAQELGYFAVAVKISMFMVLPIQAFQMAWGPFSLSLFREKDSIITFNWVLKFFSLGILSLVLIISVSSGWLISFLATDRYLDSVAIIFPMLLALAIESIAWITMVGIGFSKRSFFDLITCLAYVLISTYMSYLFVLKFGFYGVAWGSLVGSIFKALLGTFIAQKLHYQAWNLRGVLLLGGIVLSMGLLAKLLYVFYSPTIGSVALLVCLLLIWFPGVLILFNRDELRSLKSLILNSKFRFRKA